MNKSPENSSLEGKLFDVPTIEQSEPADQPVRISPPHAELVEDFKRSREQLLTPNREPDIHEIFQEIKAEEIARDADIRKQTEQQGVSGIATITTPEQEVMLAEKIEQKAGQVGGKIPILAAYPRKSKRNNS